MSIKLGSPRWEVEYRHGRATVVFPYGFDRSNLIEVTCISDAYARFLNNKYGGVVDCAKFAEQMQADLEQDLHCDGKDRK